MIFKNNLFVITSILILVIALYCPALPQLGDCNSDGVVGSPDMVMLVSYLFQGGPPPAMDDCDCDAFPGVNYGDLLQLQGSIFGTAPLYPPFGTDIPVTSHVKFFFNVQVPPNTANYTLNIYVDVPVGLSIKSFLLPFSFAATGTQAAVTCNFIDFTGTVGNITHLSSSIDNNTDIFIIQANAMGNTVLLAGTSGLLCSIDFTSAAGDPNDIIMTSTNRLWPMLLRNDYYPGVDANRIYLPEVIRAPYGDVNSDGTCNISDAIYIINYAFAGGPPPGNNEP